MACVNVTLQLTPLKKTPCKERDSEGCWMTYTLQQKDGRDSYYMYVEDSRGEAEGCLGRNTIWHGLNMVTSTLTMRSLQTFSAEDCRGEHLSSVGQDRPISRTRAIQDTWAGQHCKTGWQPSAFPVPWLSLSLCSPYLALHEEMNSRWHFLTVTPYWV